MELKYGPYSASRMDVATCGHAFRLTYMPREDGTLPPREARGIIQDRGSAQHEINEHITKRLCADPNYKFSQTEIRDLITEKVKKFPAAIAELSAITAMTDLYLHRPPPVLTSDAQVERKMAMKFMGMQKGWVHKRTRVRSVEVPNWPPITYTRQDGTEVSEEAAVEWSWPVFAECDYDDPSAFVRCKIDILTISDDTTTAIIYDHKTQPNIEDADTFQMGVYAWIVGRINHYLSEVRTVLHFARYGRYSDPFIWSLADLERIEDDFMTRVQIVETRTDFAAVPHKGCQYCPHLSACPAMRKHLAPGDDGQWRRVPGAIKIMGDTKNAAEVAGLLHVLDDLRKECQRELREYVKASEHPIAIPGKVYAYWASPEQVNWDKVNGSLRAETYAIFKKHDVDPKLFMGFSQTFSLDVWKLSNPELVKELSALFPRRSKTEFEGKNV